MGGLSRSKGQRGEREVAALLSELTGHDVRRRVRNHAGDSDLQGLPGWEIEVKFYAAVTPGLVRLSLGIENVVDILADLETGFAAARAVTTASNASA